MSTFLRFLLAILALVAVGWGLRVTLFRDDPIEVTVFRVATGLVEETVTNSKAGTIRSRRRASLSPEMGGRVVELPFQKGDRIQKGDMLLRIWDGELKDQVRLQESAVGTARAVKKESCVAAAQAERDLVRARELFKDAVISEDSVEQAISKRDRLQATCGAAEAREHEAAARLRLTRTQLDRATVVAPFDGIVAELRTELGEFVSPGATGVFIEAVLDLVDPKALYVSAPLDEVDVGKVSVGQVVRVSIDPFPDETFAGIVTRVAPYVEGSVDQNRTFEVEVELDDLATLSRLIPGTTADVEVILQRREGALRIPSYALLEGGRVLVVEGERLVSKTVTTGLRNWQFVETTGGLLAGEAVVVSLDRAEVAEGAVVVIDSETLK